jgi:hypothetical protein
MWVRLAAMRERGILRVAIVALLVPLLLGVASADAKKKHKKPKSPPVTVISASKPTSADGQTVTVTATCPSGLLAVGGGFLTPTVFDSGAPTDINIVYESRRSGDAAWQVSAAREDTGGSGPDLAVTANVDCRSAKLAVKKPAGKKASAAKKKKRKKLTITEVSASATAAGSSGSQATAAANCPPNTQALGGGFSSSPAPNLSNPLSYPFFWANYRNSPTSWTAAFSNVGSAARTVTGYAYCATGLKIAELTTTAPLAGSSSTASTATAMTPHCPGGKALLGGGFNNTPATASSAVAILTGSEPVNGSWQVSGFNFSPTSGTIGSSSYCA